MIVGNLYKYNNARNVFADINSHQTVDNIKQGEPFVFLDSKELKWVEAYKVLTINGVIGWIHIGYPEDIRKY